MKITIAAATRFEIEEQKLHSGKHNIQFLYTSVGLLSSSVSLTQHVFQEKPDLVIQAGIAGAYHKRELGKVVAVKRESVGDMGVYEKGRWYDLFDFGFVQPDETPYKNRFLPNDEIEKYNVLLLDPVSGVSVNQITTDENMADTFRTLYYGDVETMEGAALHYVCRLFGVSFIQIRGISNYVGERDKKQWKMKEAIENLNEVVGKMLSLL